MDKYRIPREPNLMQHYFGRDSAVYDILHHMRLDYVKGQAPRVDDCLIRRANKEINSVRAALDKSTYPFMRDFNEYVFGGLKRQRVVLLIEGKFLGERALESVIGVDLGIDPHDLYKGHNVKGTIDDAIALEKTEKFLDGARVTLRRNNWEAFSVNASKFFYFEDDELSKFQIDGQIDLRKLIPLVTETKSYVGIQPLEIPSKKQYLEDSPRFVSYRLKTSLKKKLLWKLGLKEIGEQSMISDWAASRVITSDKEEARRLVNFLESSPRIGQSGVQFILTKDFYSEPKPNEYRGYKVVVLVSTPGHKPSVREIQVVDRNQYYDNEINPNSPAHHAKHKQKVNRLKGKENVRDVCDILLEKMFGRSEELIQI